MKVLLKAGKGGMIPCVDHNSSARALGGGKEIEREKRKKQKTVVGGWWRLRGNRARGKEGTRERDEERRRGDHRCQGVPVLPAEEGT